MPWLKTFPETLCQLFGSNLARFLSVNCILKDGDHFNKHKDYIFEIEDYLTQNMAAEALKFQELLPKKNKFIQSLNELGVDFENSIKEIYDQIDSDYSAFKDSFVAALDSARDQLKLKFFEEIDLRKKEIEKLSLELESVKDLEGIEVDKNEVMDSLLEELEESSSIPSSFYISLYNFVSMDKNEQKNLKNTISEVEDFDRQYKSKKFESYGKLFQEFQKSSKKDSELLEKLLKDFSNDGKKSAINKKFKERIDKVFISEISNSGLSFSDPKSSVITETVPVAKIETEPLVINITSFFRQALEEKSKILTEEEKNAKLTQELREMLQKSAEKSKKQREGLNIDPSVFEKNPELKTVLDNPLVQNLLMQDRELLQPLQQKAKIQRNPGIQNQAGDLDNNVTLTLTQRVQLMKQQSKTMMNQNSQAALIKSHYYGDLPGLKPLVMGNSTQNAMKINLAQLQQKPGHVVFQNPQNFQGNLGSNHLILRQNMQQYNQVANMNQLNTQGPKPAQEKPTQTQLLAQQQKQRYQQAMLKENMMNQSKDGFQKINIASVVQSKFVDTDSLQSKQIQPQILRLARSQPGELSNEYLMKRQLLHENKEFDNLDISIKKKKIGNDLPVQNEIVSQA